jgi:hypothetical protein
MEKAKINDEIDLTAETLLGRDEDPYKIGIDTQRRQDHRTVQSLYARIHTGYIKTIGGIEIVLSDDFSETSSYDIDAKYNKTTQDDSDRCYNLLYGSTPEGSPNFDPWFSYYDKACLRCGEAFDNGLHARYTKYGLCHVCQHVENSEIVQYQIK